MVFIGFLLVEGVGRYDSELCYFKWIGMLLYLSFNTPFENVYNALGCVRLISNYLIF